MKSWDDINNELAKPLDLSLVRIREERGDRMPYLEGDQVINLANAIFDPDGWETHLHSLETHILSTGDKGKTMYLGAYSVTVTGLDRKGDKVSVTKSDIGKATATGPSEAMHEMSASGCMTDALKRCFRHFGSRFGITLYDKEHPDFLAVIGRGAKKAAPSEQKASTSTAHKAPEKAAEAVGDALKRALGYKIPGKTIQAGVEIIIPLAGTTLEEASATKLGRDITIWLAGLGATPNGIAPFVPSTDEETKLQFAARYVCINLEKLNKALSAEQKAAAVQEK